MIVRVFYNSKAFENVLMVKLDDADVVESETKNNITKLYDENHAIIGYNINIVFKSDSDGYQTMSEELLDLINNEINNTFNETITHDFNDYILVGKVISCKSHLDSDHLHICEVDIKREILTIVCGAHNVKSDEMVVVACINAVLPNGKLIKAGKLRGVESFGMLCSEFELGLIKEKQKGILIVDDSHSIGDAYF